MEGMRMKPANGMRRWLFAGGLIGAVVFFMMCGFRILNPFYYKWIFNAYHDSILSFFGWIFYEKTPINEALFGIYDLSYPHELSIIFSDVIIPFAVLLKPICKLFLPEGIVFQYIGLWSLTCYVLQGMFAALLFFKCAGRRAARFTGILMMCLSPCMAQRLFFHNTLTAHWLIVAALCICAYRDELGKKRYAAWVGLMTFSASIHLYFVPMLAIMMVFDMLYDVIQNRSMRYPLAVLAASLVCSVALVAVLGGFSTEVSDADQAWSYGILYKYSSNLLTWINPLGYSRFLPELPQMEEEYEGYGYLGLGMLALVFLSFSLLMFKKRRHGTIWENKAKAGCFFGCIAVSFLLASGPRITMGNRVLVSIPLPWFLDYVFAIFRSIGRFIWIAYYMLIAGAVCVTDQYGKEIIKNDRSIAAVFFSLAMLQAADLSPMIAQKHAVISGNDGWESEIKDEKWAELARTHKYVYIITAYIGSRPNNHTYSMVMYAWQHNLKLTSCFFAHQNDVLQEESERYYEDICSGNPDQDAIYWFEKEEYMENAAKYLHCEELDGYYIGWSE